MQQVFNLDQDREPVSAFNGLSAIPISAATYIILYSMLLQLTGRAFGFYEWSWQSYFYTFLMQKHNQS